jgi:hypothetical protein
MSPTLLGDEATVRRRALDLIVRLDEDHASGQSLLQSIDPGDDTESADALNREIEDLD